MSRTSFFLTGLAVGVCLAGCSGAGNQCNSSVCSEATDACEPQPANEGLSCDDGLFCTTGETCNSGACGGGAATDCSGSGDQCNTGVCNETTDACEGQPANEGQGCDDGQFCTTGETCSSGACGGGSFTKCSDENIQAVDVCPDVAGRSFLSVGDQSDVGLGPDGVLLGHWGVSFDLSGKYYWSYSDVEESGDYTCDGLDVLGQLGRFDEVLWETAGEFDPETGILIWDGVEYIEQTGDDS
jgi:hypothetical protein